MNAKFEKAVRRLLESDPWLKPYEKIIRRRLLNIAETEQRLTRGKMSLIDFAAGHAYFGLHFDDKQWIFREWAPNATAIFLIGDMSGWQEKEEFALSGKSALLQIHLTTATFTGCAFTGRGAAEIASRLTPGAWFRIGKH
jgi:hypothetical protein